MDIFTEIIDENTYINLHKIDSKNEKTYQILVRPDVTEDSLLTLCQQILITYGGYINRINAENPEGIQHEIMKTSKSLTTLPKQLDNSNNNNNNKGIKMNISNATSTTMIKNSSKESIKEQEDIKDRNLISYLESTNNTTSSSTLPWQNIKIYVGVNMDLNRCIIVSIKPLSTATIPYSTTGTTTSNNIDAQLIKRNNNVGIFDGIGINTYTTLLSTDTTTTATPTINLTTIQQAYLNFCENFITEINSALREECLTLDYMASVPVHLTGPVQLSGTATYSNISSHSSSGNKEPKSLIDLGFIRDLHCATIQLMVSILYCNVIILRY